MLGIFWFFEKWFEINYAIYARVLEMAQKVIEGGIVTWMHMHEILRWLNFEFAQNLGHVSKPRDGSLFQT